MQRLHVLVFLALSLFASPLAAQELESPTNENTLVRVSSAVKQAPLMLPMMFKGVEKAVANKLEMVIFKDHNTGEEACIRLTPVMPGAKLGFTYTF